jgi:hypothetical protein
MGPISLNPSDVDLDDPTYLIPHFGELEPLVKSVKAVGLINKPLVQRLSDNRLVPVLGRRRLAAASIVGLTAIDAREAPSVVSERECYRLAFWENCGHRKLDRAAAAVVVRRLMELFPVQTVADEFLPALGIQARGPKLAGLCKIGGLEPPILKTFSAGRIQERTSVLLAEMDVKDRLAMFRLITRLGTNANKSAEIVGYLHDLSIVRGQSVRELLQEHGAAGVMADEEIPLPERAQRFRDLLRSWKFPELVEQEREFVSWKKELSLPAGVEVRPVESFEGEECFVEIRVRSRDEAERLLSALPAESSHIP